jgi:hypothetical protein
MRFASHCVIFESSSRSRLTAWASMLVCATRSGIWTVRAVRSRYGRGLDKSEDLTKKSEQVLAAVDIAQSLARMIAVALLELLVPVEVQVPLEPIEEDAPESFVEVFLDSGDDFFEDVGVCRTGTTMCHLGLLVLVEELCDGDGGGRWRDLVLFGDFLPVVHKDGFESVGDEDFDCGSAHELILL